MKPSGQLGHDLVTIVLQIEPPLDQTLDGANVPAHSIPLVSVSTSVLDGLPSDPIVSV